MILATAPAAWARHSFPKLRAKDLHRYPDSLMQFDGKAKIIVLNLWATWRVPCQQGMPTLVKGPARFHNRDVRVIGVSVDDLVYRQKILRLIE